ncbi:MAG: DUF1622 domain-containing protein [Synechococcaceae cyanobacterium RL_1_2]|nr:DUF1622 domain-containing protein [Synechococcaceae cyanobacterium RL_1_2]
MIIAFGVIRGLFIFIKETLFSQETAQAFQHSRLVMGYSFSLGLSFLIGATILRTMVSSQWDDLARLAVIILIRTTVNLLLERATKLNHQVISPSPSPTTPIHS